MKKILIYNSGGGLGDSIQIIPLILSLQNHYRRSKIFYLGAHQNHFEGKLKEYNIKIETLDLNMKYFGFRWWHYLYVKKNFNIKNQAIFDLIIDLQSKIRNSLILKKIPHINFYSTTYNNLFSTKEIKFKSKKAEYPNTPNKNKKNPKIIKNSLVVLISIIALIVLTDTFKYQLKNYFPGLDSILNNLYESLKDLLLFFKDLIN